MVQSTLILGKEFNCESLGPPAWPGPGLCCPGSGLAGLEGGGQRGRLTYEGVEGRVGAHTAHLVDGLEGQDVFLVLGAAQRAAGAAAGAEVPGGECHRAARWPGHTGQVRVVPRPALCSDN